MLCLPICFSNLYFESLKLTYGSNSNHPPNSWLFRIAHCHFLFYWKGRFKCSIFQSQQISTLVFGRLRYDRRIAIWSDLYFCARRSRSKSVWLSTSCVRIPSRLFGHRVCFVTYLLQPQPYIHLYIFGRSIWKNQL